jgi:predicted nucleotidyltransferase
MRLTPDQIETIKSTTAAVLGQGVGVTLFGSRLDDRQKGDDIDLYIEVPQPELMRQIRCKVRLQERLDMPVDLVVKPLGDDSPISRIAKAEGVVLRTTTKR